MSFFDGVSPFANTIHAYAESSDKSLTFRIRQQIVDSIIVDAFLNPEEHGGTSHSRTFGLFQNASPESHGWRDYQVFIENTTQFRLISNYLSIGLSFRQVSSVLESTEHILGYE